VHHQGWGIKVCHPISKHSTCSYLLS
jgi:hypothetical protein